MSLRSLLGLLVTLLTGVLSVPAHAQFEIRQTRPFGSWEQRLEVDRGNGALACSVSTSQLGNGRFVIITSLLTTQQVQVSLIDRSWAIPSGSRGNVTIDIDGRRWPVTMQDSGPTALITLFRFGDDLVAFLQAFALGNTFTILMPADRWTVDLRGSHDASTAMMQCIDSNGGWGARSR